MMNSNNRFPNFGIPTPENLRKISENLLNDLVSIHLVNKNNFPYDNIILENENKGSIEIAIAGYDPKDISVKTEENILIVSSEKMDNDEEIAEDNNKKYLTKNISTKSWMKRYILNPYTVVKDVSYKFGILTIQFERELPEHLKPRNYSVNLSEENKDEKQKITKKSNKE